MLCITCMAAAIFGPLLPQTNPKTRALGAASGSGRKWAAIPQKLGTRPISTPCGWTVGVIPGQEFSRLRREIGGGTGRSSDMPNKLSVKSSLELYS